MRRWDLLRPINEYTAKELSFLDQIQSCSRNSREHFWMFDANRKKMVSSNPKHVVRQSVPELWGYRWDECRPSPRVSNRSGKPLSVSQWNPWVDCTRFNEGSTDFSEHGRPRLHRTSIQEWRRIRSARRRDDFPDCRIGRTAALQPVSFCISTEK